MVSPNIVQFFRPLAIRHAALTFDTRPRLFYRHFRFKATANVIPDP